MSERNGDSGKQFSLWGAIVEVAQGLRNQPLLLLGFGLGIILLAAGALALESLRTIAISLIVFLVVVLVVWVVYQAMLLRTSTRTGAKIQGGAAVVSERASLDETKVKGGAVSLSETPSPGTTIVAGDASVAAGVKAKKSTVEGGSVKIGK